MRLCYQIRDILRTRAPFVIARDGRMSADLTAGRVTIGSNMITVLSQR